MVTFQQEFSTCKSKWVHFDPHRENKTGAHANEAQLALFLFCKDFLGMECTEALTRNIGAFCSNSVHSVNWPSPSAKGFLVSLNSSEVTSWMYTIYCFGILFKIEHFQEFLALVHKCPFAKVVSIQIQLPQRLPSDKIELLQDILTCTILAAYCVPTCIGTAIKVKIP